MNNIIEHTYRYYERENKYATIILPTPNKVSKIDHVEHIQYHCTYKSGLLKEKSGYITLKVLTPSAGNIQRFYLIAYD